MESFGEYLISEQETSDVDETTWEKVKEVLKKKCKPVLRDLKRGGVEDLPFIGKWTRFNGPVKIRKTRKDRMPKDTPGDVHEIFNEMLYEYTGVYGRSETIFATGKFTQADSYGNVYYVLPVGKYNVVWNPDVDDLYSLWDSNSSFTWAIDVMSGNPPEIDPRDIEDEWERIYGEGEQGYWEYSDITVDSPEKDAAVAEVLEILELDPDVSFSDTRDYEKKYYENFWDNIRPVQEQTTLFDAPTAVEVFNANPDRDAGESWLMKDEDSEFYVDRLGEIIENKHGQSNFNDKETAWEAFRRFKMKAGIEDYGYSLSLEILSNYYDEEWASRILDKVIDESSSSIDDDIEDNIAWMPDVSLQEFTEMKEEEYGNQDEAESIIRDVFSGYVKGDIHRAIRAEVEMMIECDYYILIKTDYGDRIIDWINKEW